MTTFFLLFFLVTGEVAEMPVTKEQCQETLDTAARSNQIIVHLAVSGRVEHVPALRVVCVEKSEGEAPESAQK